MITQQQHSTKPFSRVKAIVAAPSCAFEDEMDLDFHIHCLRLREEEVREGLRHAVANLKGVVRRVKRRDASVAEAAQVILSDLECEEAKLLSRPATTMLGDIPRFVDARWYLERYESQGKVSEAVLRGVRVWDAVCVRKV
jgi:hypothetical protein